MDTLHDLSDGKNPRTYRKCARKDYLKYSRSRRHTEKTTRKAIGKQLNYLRRDLDAIDAKLRLGRELPPRQAQRLDMLRTIYEQQKTCMTFGALDGSTEKLAFVQLTLIRSWGN